MVFIRKDAKIYLRKNGAFGAECDGVLDTGHTIQEDSGLFTVFSQDNTDTPIISRATRLEAEKAITDDWRQA